MIYCVGDSFTAGDELLDYNINKTGRHKSDFAWPKVLEDLLQQPVCNLGRGGTGNTRIVKRTMELTLQKIASVVIIAWSDPQRIEMADDAGIWDVWGSRNISMLETDYRSIPVKWLAAYQTDTVVAEWYQANWLRQVLLLQCFLEKHQQKYIMLQSQGSDSWNYRNPHKLKNLKNEVDSKYFIGWPDLSMLSWTMGLPTGVHGHFLEQGHNVVANKIYTHIRDLGWIS